MQPAQVRLKPGTTPDPGAAGSRQPKLDRRALLARRAPVLLSLALSGAVCVLATVAAVGELAHVTGLALLVLVTAVTFLAAAPSSSRERAFASASGVVFAGALWVGSGTASAAAILAMLVLARLSTENQQVRARLAWAGVQLSAAALAAGVVMKLIPAAASPSLMPADLMQALGRAALAACVFGVVSSLPLGTIAAPRYAVILPADRQHSLRAMYHLAALAPVAVLAPLGSAYGLLAGLPAILIIILSIHVAALRADAVSLRNQLRVAEEMGRASVEENSSVAPQPLLERFLKLAAELVPSDRSLVWSLNSSTGELTPAAALPFAGPFDRKTARYGEGLIGHAAARVRPRLIPDAAQDPHRGRREAAAGAWLLYPIVVRGQVAGVAHWVRPVQQPFTLDDIAMLDALVPQATVALENITIRAQIQQLASTDGLTGLWNQRRTQELLRDELRRAARYHRPLSLLMLDVDSFKSFNDTYGHLQGDHLLRSIATLLRTNVRSVDHVGRYGGEEFLVLLPETAKDDACRMAERIRRAVEERAFVKMEETVVRRTISVGVAAYPEDALNSAELVERADEALYRAKRSGKNCVIWA